MIPRRSFLTAMLAAAAAPAFVRPTSLMPLWLPKPRFVGGDSFPRSDAFLALYGPDGKEISGNGYARVPYVEGQDTVWFPSPTGSWGTVTHVLAGGLLLPINNGQSPHLLPGDSLTLTLTIDKGNT